MVADKVAMSTSDMVSNMVSHWRMHITSKKPRAEPMANLGERKNQPNNAKMTSMMMPGTERSTSEKPSMRKLMMAEKASKSTAALSVSQSMPSETQSPTGMRGNAF